MSVPSNPSRRLRVLALEPYAALSHVRFLEGLRACSRHAIEIATLPARGWKWRMRTAALHFAEPVARGAHDVLLVSDYLNLAELVALLPPGRRDVRALVYFHENQLTYPLQDGERRDHHYALTHVYALLAAERALFNSAWHRDSFLAALEQLLAHVPDVDVTQLPARIRARSAVLPLGTDVPAGAPRPAGAEREPLVVWNHRFEYDKNPDGLVAAVEHALEHGPRFRLRLLGQRFRSEPPAFGRLRALLGARLEDHGFVPDRAAYLGALGGGDVVLSTAWHEFFGLGTLEAIRAGLVPVLPRDLAYPELLPEAEREASRFLYDRGEGAGPALVRALEAVRRGGWSEERRALVAYTDRFAWDALAPRYDRAIEEAAAR